MIQEAKRISGSAAIHSQADPIYLHDLCKHQLSKSALAVFAFAFWFGLRPMEAQQLCRQFVSLSTQKNLTASSSSSSNQVTLISLKIDKLDQKYSYGKTATIVAKCVCESITSELSHLCPCKQYKELPSLPLESLSDSAKEANIKKLHGLRVAAALCCLTNQSSTSIVTISLRWSLPELWCLYTRSTSRSETPLYPQWLA